MCSFHKKENGASALEYVLLVGLVVTAIAGAVVFLGGGPSEKPAAKSGIEQTK